MLPGAVGKTAAGFYGATKRTETLMTMLADPPKSDAVLDTPASEVVEAPPAEQETAPGPEAAKGMADATAPAPTVEKKPEPFDIVKAAEDFIQRLTDTAENDEEEVTAKVIRQSRSVARLNIALLRIKAAEKGLKEKLEEAVDMLDSLEREARYEVERKKVQPDLPFGEKPAEAAAPGEPPPPQDDTAWRSVTLESLTPAIPQKKLQLLAEHVPPITTMGEFSDWQQKKGDPWWWKDIKGLGEGGMTAIVNAADTYWAANPRHIVTPENVTAAAEALGQDVKVEGVPGNVTVTVGDASGS